MIIRPPSHILIGNHDRVDPSIRGVETNTPIRKRNRWGEYWDFTAASSEYVDWGNAFDVFPDREFTFAVKYRIPTGAGGSFPFSARLDADTDTGGVEYLFSAAGPTVGMRLTDGITSLTFANTSLSFTGHFDKWVIGMCSWNATTDLVTNRLYDALTGALIDSASSSADDLTTLSEMTQNLRFANRGTNYFDGDVEFLTVWPDQIHTAHQDAFAKNPYQVFEPRKIWLPAGVEADAGGDDDLLADDIQSTSEVGNPVIGQEHAILADDVQSTSEVGTPVVGQEHALLADDVQSTSEVSVPAVSESNILLADDVQSTSEVGTPVIGQEHAILADDVQSTSEVSTPVVGQEHALLADDVQSTSEVSTPAIAEGEHALLADDVQSTSELSVPVLTHIHVLTPNNAESASEVSAPVITQVHGMLAVSLESLSEVSAVGLDSVSVARVVELTAKMDVGVVLTGRFDVGTTAEGKFDESVTLSGEADPL